MAGHLPGHFVFAPLFRSHRADGARTRCDYACPREFVRTLVHGMARMALDPVPVHLVVGKRVIETLP